VLRSEDRLRKKTRSSRTLIEHLDGTTGAIAPASGSPSDARPENSGRRLNQILDAQVRRIAQALHDETGQLLTAAHIALADASHSLPAESRRHLRHVKTYLDQIEEHVRRLADELRPRILDDLGLVPALEFLAQGVEKRRGIAITIDAALGQGLPRVVETTIYHLVQEALTNTGRYARATRAVVRLSIGSGSLRCTVKDDGVGFDTAAVLGRNGGIGCELVAIREQVMALGGTFQITSAPESGTELEIAIPLEM
jgi:signal transduction histidine kinase